MSMAQCKVCDSYIDTDEDEYYTSGVDCICQACVERIYEESEGD